MPPPSEPPPGPASPLASDGRPPPQATVTQMLMMVSLPGKERTEAEWRALYAAAGLRVASITLVNSRSGESVIAGVVA